MVSLESIITLPYIYLAYMFISLYMLLFFIILYLKNKDQMLSFPVPAKQYTVSVMIPAYNEQDTIKDTVESVLSSSYPLEEIIVINDGSKDKTKEIIQQLQKKYPKVKLLDKPNSGKGDSLNQAAKIASGELLAVVDSDSYLTPDSIKKMTGFFNDQSIGAVTSAVLVKNRNKFIEKLQAFEYIIIAWTRKLLEYVDGVYVTPGPLSLYRKSALEQVKGFDSTNMTEDIEITWKLIHNNYKIRMCLASRVYTVVPSKFKKWFKQRIRWNVGGTQTLLKYKKDATKKGLGSFIIPFFTISLIIGLIGLFVFTYLSSKNIINTILYTKYTVQARTEWLRLDELYVTPTVLNIFGISLFIAGFFFTVFALRFMKEYESLKKRNLFALLFYLIIYLAIYPFILVISLISLISGKYSWGTK